MRVYVYLISHKDILPVHKRHKKGFQVIEWVSVSNERGGWTGEGVVSANTIKQGWTWSFNQVLTRSMKVSCDFWFHCRFSWFFFLTPQTNEIRGNYYLHFYSRISSHFSATLFLFCFFFYIFLLSIITNRFFFILHLEDFLTTKETSNKDTGFFHLF